jgi:hypothetical protein
MSEGLNLMNEAIEREHSHESASTRRQLVAGAAGVVGGMGLLAMPGVATAAGLTPRGRRMATDLQTLVNVAATAEVLATIVNTVGAEQVSLDAVTKANVQAAAREELIHYQVLTSSAIGGQPATTKIWVPDTVFSSAENLLATLVAGDQIFINAYLIGTTAFAHKGLYKQARYSAEIMGVEAVHRALALQSLGKLGNDRAFMKYSQIERNSTDPFGGKPGFRKITTAVTYLESAGFGFGQPGAAPGKFYDFANVSKRTPNPAGVNTLTPR